jgi:SEC-C motif-containing protein
MRSRYTAYVTGDENYLLETWAPEHRPAGLNLDPKQKWLGLKVKRTEAGGSNDDAGIVEFVARYKIDGRGHRLHEVSRFRRENGKWLYETGKVGDPTSRKS